MPFCDTPTCKEFLGRGALWRRTLAGSSQKKPPLISGTGGGVSVVTSPVAAQACRKSPSWVGK
jgi:hypothetical protein